MRIEKEYSSLKDCINGKPILKKIGQGLSESIKHLEMGALLSNEQLLSMKNEATSSTSGVS